MFVRLRRRGGDSESGSAMIAVVGLMGITVVIAISVASASINALSFTSATRAGVQSQAAAEAGIDFTVGALKSTMACAPTYSSPAGGPSFTTALSYATTATIPSSATGWTPGCPPRSATFVRIESQGTATAKGVSGNTIGNKNKVEAVFNFIGAAAPIAASGAAAYSYSTGVLNNLTLLDGGNLNADVRIKTGSVDCQSNTVINGSVRLANGYFQSSGSCRVTGSVSASQYVAVNNGSSIGGDITAGGASLYNQTAATVVGTGSQSAGGGKAVGGNILAGGPVTTSGVVAGNVTATPLPGGAVGQKSTITPDSTRIGGYLAAAGEFDSWAARCASPRNTWDAAGNACAIKQNGNVTGAVSYNVSGLTAPAAPVVPDWVDYNFTPSEWTALGYTVVTWPGTSDACRIDNRTVTFPAVTALSAYTTPTVIDARACTTFGLDFSLSGALNLNLKTDIAFIAPKIDIGKLTASSNNATQRKLWFIVPDTTANVLPTPTAANCGVDIKNDTRISNTVSALVYTPCKISNSAAVWSGQMYGGTVSFDTNITLTFEPVGLPNVDLDGGVVAAPTPGSPGGLGSRVSIRDIATT
jgi:hypothetical protein